MAKMRAAMAAVLVLEKENVTQAFGVPGAAINRSRARAIVLRGASHIGRGLYPRPGRQYRRVHRHLGAGRHRHDHGAVLGQRRQHPHPVHHRPGAARPPGEDFQAVDIESIAKPVTKWAVTVREPALVPRVLQQAFHLMRSGRPGPVLVDLPFDVQMAEIDFDIDTYEPCRCTSPAPRASRSRRRWTCWPPSDRP